MRALHHEFFCLLFVNLLNSYDWRVKLMFHARFRTALEQKWQKIQHNLKQFDENSLSLTLANNVHKLRRHFVWNLCTNAKIFPFEMWHFVSPFLRSNFCWMHIFFLFTWKEKVMHAKLMKWSRHSSKKKYSFNSISIGNFWYHGQLYQT